MSEDTEEEESEEDSDSYGETSEEQPDESMMGSPMRAGMGSPLRTGASNFLESPSPLLSKSMLNSVSRKESTVHDSMIDEFNPLRFLALQLKEYNEMEKAKQVNINIQEQS